jgi:hypothetical protein
VNQAVRIILAMALGFGMTIAAVEVSDQVAAEARGARLGRLDFYAFCDREWGMDFGPTNPTSAPLGWACTRTGPPVVTHSVDVQVACAVLYGSPAYASIRNVSSAFSWECFRGPSPSP